MKTRRYIFIFAGILVLGVVVYFLFFNQEATTQVSVKVSKGQFPIEITTSGELLAKRSEKILGPDGLRQFQIYQIKIVDMIPDGTIVDSGQYVATLDRSEISNKIKDEENNLEKLESQLVKTKLDTALNLRSARDELINLKYDLEQRKLELEQSKFEPPAAIRQAQIALEKADRSYNQAGKNYQLRLDKALADMQEVTASYKQAQRKVEQMTSTLNLFTVKAPKSGMVVYRRTFDGQKGGIGSMTYWWENYAVAELPDLREMISKTYVNEIDISKVKVGQKVKIGIDAFPDKIFSGKVTEVANIGEQLPNSNAKVFEVKLQVNEYDSILRPGMTTKNTIITAILDNVLFVPMEAMFNDDSVSYVFRKRGSSVIKQQVIAGLSNDNDIIIRAGLSKDDQVLLVPPENADKIKTEYLPPQIVKKFEAKPPALPVAKPPVKDTLASQAKHIQTELQKN